MEHIIKIKECSDGGYTASFETLPGIATQGDSISDVLTALVDAYEATQEANKLDKFEIRHFRHVSNNTEGFSCIYGNESFTLPNKVAGRLAGFKMWEDKELLFKAIKLLVDFYTKHGDYMFLNQNINDNSIVIESNNNGDYYMLEITEYGEATNLHSSLNTRYVETIYLK